MDHYITFHTRWYGCLWICCNFLVASLSFCTNVCFSCKDWYDFFSELRTCTYLYTYTDDSIFVSADHKARTNTNMFLCSLSIADLIMLMVCVPIEIFRMFAVILDFGSPSCTIGSYILMISFSASVLNLTAVSLER